MGMIPTAAERASLRFSYGSMSLGVRYTLAGLLFIIGSALWIASGVRPLGLLLVVLGHLPLWVRSQRLAPGGATPIHEEVWAPADDDWYDRLLRLERAGARWDASPWDISNAMGFLGLFFFGFIGIVVFFLSRSLFGSAVAWDLLILGGFLFLPVWLNGMRTVWHPSELRLKGGVLKVAREVAESARPGGFEPVPLLALRDGPRGQYPVDARLMLRPREAADDDFIGVQVQVAMNNVRGRDYPYLYCVLLAKGKAVFPRAKVAEHLVLEKGSDEGVSYLVVRQYADNSGGWHTGPGDIAVIVQSALTLADRYLAASRR